MRVLKTCRRCPALRPTARATSWGRRNVAGDSAINRQAASAQPGSPPPPDGRRSPARLRKRPSNSPARQSRSKRSNGPVPGADSVNTRKSCGISGSARSFRCRTARSGTAHSTPRHRITTHSSTPGVRMYWMWRSRAGYRVTSPGWISQRRPSAVSVHPVPSTWWTSSMPSWACQGQALDAASSFRKAPNTVKSMRPMVPRNVPERKASAPSGIGFHRRLLDSIPLAWRAPPA